MISRKEFSSKLKKAEIKKIENIFRQIVEKKPYLLEEFNEKSSFMNLKGL